ncbi:MAG: noncanonical pyrimidine nucleotidase, YjjG family [Ruminococcaceae bacterium]|nr:noncanonical pyrimidine nucleotidase, YjjG family [Oscillospiraceae bacterium]
MKQYTTIYFDLDNTLLDFSKSEYNAIRKLLSIHNLPVSDEIAEVYSKINQTFWEAFERGDIKKEEIFAGRFKKLLEHLGEERDAEVMAKDYFKCLSEGHDLIDGAEEILNRLKTQGYKLYATTNGVASTQYRRIKESGLEPLFDGIFVSEKIGHQKPSREYFDCVLQGTPEKDKSKILIIGDSQSSDILGGVNSGIDTCWYNPKGLKATYFSKYEISALCELEKILC